MRASTSLQPACLILAVALLCALPAFAAETQAPAQPAPPAAPLAAPACLAPALTGLLTPAQPVESADIPAWLDLGSEKRFHGYCHCGCSTIPDCNNDADCGGASCGRGISCC
jgi:hypothetical protein